MERGKSGQVSGRIQAQPGPCAGQELNTHTCPHSFFMEGSDPAQTAWAPAGRVQIATPTINPRKRDQLSVPIFRGCTEFNYLLLSPEPWSVRLNMYCLME